MALIYSTSSIFKKTVERADFFAPTPWPVLLLGETGVGKEVLARRIHDHSNRRSGPFIPVNCGALPAGLFESELFGFERGAFSGAISPSKGLVRHAHGGTLFLDEVGDLEFPLQVKLLRLIDQGEVRSLGGNRIERVDVRIIAATNVNLFEAVRKGTFRLDLLERLSVLTLKIPSLKERAEDISLLAQSFLTEIGATATENAFSPLTQYDWPGNIRELKNVVIRASLFDKKITADHVRQVLDECRENTLAATSENKTFSAGTLDDIEKEIIVERLKRCHGNRKRTAEDLGIAKSTLHEKLRKWQLEEEGDVAWPIARTLSAPRAVAGVCQL
jgi:transcriptional regulator with PAS, ATPase and Fis domain